MQSLVIVVIALSIAALAGCASTTGYYNAPRVEEVANLSGSLAAVTLATIGDDCTAVLTLKSGKQVRPRLTSAFCQEATSLVAAEQRAQALARTAAPTPEAK